MQKKKKKKKNNNTVLCGALSSTVRHTLDIACSDTFVCACCVTPRSRPQRARVAEAGIGLVVAATDRVRRTFYISLCGIVSFHFGLLFGQLASSIGSTHKAIKM